MLLPLRLEGMSTLHPTGGPIDELFETLPVVAMVAASGDVKLTPDEDEKKSPSVPSPDVVESPAEDDTTLD